ncbi:MAG TPA: hypothetical protein DDW52_03715 [Planctomycetaceae bacterium]|nr:hypothetical protein [Planctomycetaceae bacterium]
MTPAKEPISEKLSRWLLGTLAASAMLGGIVLLSTDSLAGPSSAFFGGTLFKVGLVLGMTWLAMPQLKRFGWHRVQGAVLGAVLVVGLLLAIRPKIGALALSLLVTGSAIFSALGWIRGLLSSNSPRP